MRRLRTGRAHVEVWPDASALITRAAELLAETARQSTAARDRFTIALAGGSTPRALYERLAGEAYAPRLPWPETHVFWSDERCVPPESNESNYGMAHEALLARVAIPAEQIHRLRGEDDPRQAARDYERILEANFDESPPRFDLILLGMGADGHTASLFPDSAALEETEQLVAAPYVAELKSHRLTMTPRLINAARSVIFLVTGQAKAASLSAVLEGERDPRRYPSQLIAPESGELVWLVDEAAAGGLSL
jgi:6-phosphogluconolactonase